MEYWTEYRGHVPEIVGKRKKIDNTIYTFDIETTSYLIVNNKIVPAIKYLDLSEDERSDCVKCSNMYIWQFSINNIVYYGRYWSEFLEFLDRLEEASSYPKIVYVHNLAFEFTYLSTILKFDKVLARVSRKVMRANLSDYNIELRCSYILSNCGLAYLPKLFNLPVEKKVGDLDYNLMRHAKTPLSDKELGYCEYDCLVVYEYIKIELATYGRVDKIPLTSTGHVRRELQELVIKDYNYRNKVFKAINVEPHIYNLLIQAFAGGYTHANWIYSDEVLYDIDSWDFTSSYPYVLVTHLFPSTEFRRCYITSIDDMLRSYAYLVVVRLTNVKTKYLNTFISKSKCRYIYGGRYDNGRIISAESLEITLTDIDLRLIVDSYDCEVEFLESYNSKYAYLPKQLINFILDKYVNKTKYKGVAGKELDYSSEKNKFNSIFGMCVTNTIRDEVLYSNEVGWEERELTNEEIINKLLEDKKKSFLSFAYGVWCTAHARNNLLRNVMKLDDHVAYCDTDSIKLLPGYDKSIIDNYNNYVIERLKNTAYNLDILFERFAPKDTKGVTRMLGLFDDDGHYSEFITQGAKKYAYRTAEDGELHITVSGVPKCGVACLDNDIRNFKDNLVFDYERTGKKMLFYSENQRQRTITDYLGISDIVTDESGCCIVPTTYELNKAFEYAALLNDSSMRAVFKEGVL